MTEYNELQQVEDLALRFNEPTWRLCQRKEAVKNIEKLALPKYEKLPIQDLELTKVNQEPYFSDAGNVYDFLETKVDQALIVQNEEQTLIEQMPKLLLDEGVILTDLMTAFTEHEELVKDYYMQVVKADENKMTAFNSAYLTSGIFLYVPANVKIAKPLEALFMQEKDANSTFVKHVLIVAEKHSEFTYVEHLTSSDNTNDVKRSGNMIVEIIAKDGAKVNYAAIDESSKNMDLFLERRANVYNHASVDFAIGSMNKGKVMANFEVDLIGDGAESNQKIVAISTKKEQQLINTCINNYGKHSIGDIMQRGVILDEGDLRFNGIGHIYPEGKHAEATQESRIMMMTDKGRGDANPMLLIDHDEVVASHAASVGQVDIETLFYLMSRGLSYEDVVRLQTYAFLSPVMKAMPNKEIKDELFIHLERALEKNV